MASDVQNGALEEITLDYDPLGDVNRRITRNRSIQEDYADPLVSPGMTKKTTLFSVPTAIMKANMQNLKKLTAVFKDKQDKEIMPFQDIENNHQAPSIQRSDSQSFTDASKSEYHVPYGDGEEDADFDTTGQVELDDGLSLMTADDYLAYRMLPMVAELSKKTPRLSSWSSTFTVCVLILSVSAAALSTFDRSDFVPAALALSGGITAWASYQQTDLRLVLTNNACSQLSQLLVWWDGLTMIEKRIPMNKETLVKTCELAIIGQATVVGAAARSKTNEAASSKGDNDNNDV